MAESPVILLQSDKEWSTVVWFVWQHIKWFSFILMSRICGLNTNAVNCRGGFKNWKNKFFLSKIVIFHTKYPNNFRFILSAPPLTWNPGSAPELYISYNLLDTFKRIRFIVLFGIIQCILSPKPQYTHALIRKQKRNLECS